VLIKYSNAMELQKIYDSLIMRGGIMLPSENEKLGQIFCNLSVNCGGIPEEERQLFDKIFKIMAERSLTH
jgi:hypothetical protein